MQSIARFDLQMDVEDKDVVARAAALMGVTMAAFVRTAAKEKARELIERDSRLTMTTKDFKDFANALNSAFTPNLALQNAMNAAQKVKRA